MLCTNIVSLTLEQGHCSVVVFHSDNYIGATHTLVKTLICALLSLRTVHFLIKTWSLSIAVRMSPEGTCGTFIVKLLSHVLTHEMLPAGCSLSQMVRASLLRVTEYMSRFEANNNGLMKEAVQVNITDLRSQLCEQTLCFHY